jgi:hypothetical protein
MLPSCVSCGTERAVQRQGRKFLQLLTPLLVGQTHDTPPINTTSQVFVARRNFEGEGTGREGDTPSAYRPITSPLTTHQQVTQPVTPH